MNVEAGFRTAQESDVEALVDLWATAFTPPLLPDQWLADERRLEHTLVAEDADGVCGSIYGLRKRLRESDGGVADVLCIGSVAVAERARGRGLARGLVSAMLAAASDADWALLYTGTPDVYRSSGFTAFTMERTQEGPWQGHDRHVATDAVESRPIESGALAPVRDAYARSRDGRVTLAPARSDLDWAMAEIRLQGMRLHAVTVRGEVTGYAITTVAGTTGMIVEAALSAETAAVVLAAISTEWRAAGVRDCSLAIPALPEEREIFRVFAPAAMGVADSTGMVRPLRRAPRLDGIRHFTGADYF